MIASLFISFSLTMIIEYVVVKIFFWKNKVFVPVLLVNLLTNPLVVYIYNILIIINWNADIILFFLEIVVFIVEAFVYKILVEIDIKKAFAISFFANAIAYLIGIIINNIFK